jgi:NAD(P)-dependent dehydrogenase (short-subunit alcohol dehydrogenase family)
LRAVVTGSEGNLGRATVAYFRARGARVACLGGPRLTTDNASEGFFAAGDLAEPAAAERGIGRAIAWLGGLDALVHIVGAFEWKSFEHSTLQDWRDLFSTNVETAVSTIKACWPHLRKGTTIVTIGAASAEPAGLGVAAYAAAKSSVARLSESLSAELSLRGCRINCVLPSIIDTPRNRLDMPDRDPCQWTTPESIAEVIYFLSTPASRAINGARIAVTNTA